MLLKVRFQADSSPTALTKPSRIRLNLPLFRSPHRDCFVRPVDILKTQTTDFSNAEAIDSEEENHAVRSRVKQRRAVTTVRRFFTSFQVGPCGRFSYV